ncbi:Adenylate cyclase [hydrothermal vent metagenome]|uniref:Adenylate cyclase n=1 Tax=hydrothermal vent metagenome TaxID=652676 RepID=A0A3B0YZB0_9ZZZZ
MPHWTQSLLAGLMVGLLGVLVAALPASWAWEEDIGLAALFKLRGSRVAPDEVVIVAIGGRTSHQLKVDEEVRNWPRTLHAQLIDQLAAAGAVVITFDIFFKKPSGDEHDRRLAKAMQDAGNVVLFAYLERKILPAGSSKTRTPANKLVQLEHLQPPIPLLADTAVAVAPFILPKVPIKVGRFWIYHDNIRLFSLPVVAQELYSATALSDYLHILEQQDPVLKQRISHSSIEKGERLSIDTLIDLRNEPEFANTLLKTLVSPAMAVLSSEHRRQIETLLATYRAPVHPYFNFYGPPLTITTVSYEDILAGDSQALASIKNKAVFVGYSGHYQTNQQDSFISVFSQSSGLDLSGVEIAATAFANLIHKETLIPLGEAAQATLIVFYGLLIFLLLRVLPPYLSIAAGLVVAILYFAVVYGVFSKANLWLPWTVPLFVQTPLAMLVTLGWHYREARLSRHRLKAIFGYYLPSEVVDRLAHDSDEALGHGEAAFGVCLATDAENYTHLAEHTDPAQLKLLMNRYYELLFTPVRARGGMISDVVGDAMLAIWSAPQDSTKLRASACHAALEIHAAFKNTHRPHQIPTRIGLHAGDLVFSHIGAIDHYEYRAVGDIVNTASRIENFNKQLGTRILISQETLSDLDGLVTRNLGSFHLKGKQQSVILHELVANTKTVSAEILALHAAFAEALSAYQADELATATRLFQAMVQRYPEDGPSRYYLNACR